MLTHELEKPENLNTYLCRALAPLRPLYTFGRSYDASPKIPRDQAIWDFWKELASHSTTHRTLSDVTMISHPFDANQGVLLVVGVCVSEVGVFLCFTLVRSL